VKRKRKTCGVTGSGERIVVCMDKVHVRSKMLLFLFAFFFSSPFVFTFRARPLKFACVSCPTKRYKVAKEPGKIDRLAKALAVEASQDEAIGKINSNFQSNPIPCGFFVPLAQT